jgi:hypothetical protein
MSVADVSGATSPTPPDCTQLPDEGHPECGGGRRLTGSSSPSRRASSSFHASFERHCALDDVRREGAPVSHTLSRLGRPHPKLWENARTGKKGYAPACANEWVQGVYEKPRVKCGECPNQAFVAVSEQTIVDHLQGRHVVGVYPLLPDGTCWFLAVDFDKRSWMDHVAVFLAPKRSAG